MRATKPVSARFVHHVWMMDVSEIKQLLGPALHLAAVFDAFSRAPLALQVFETKPTAPDMARLLRATARAFTRPKYLITDLGGKFTGGAFRRAVRRLGAVQRFAARESIKATARERFWRTLKEAAGPYRLHLPLTASDLESRLELALVHYLCFRPHEGLEGAARPQPRSRPVRLPLPAYPPEAPIGVRPMVYSRRGHLPRTPRA